MNRKVIAILVLFTLSLSVNSQKILNELDTLKHGIYRDFSELKSNSPSIPLNFKILSKKQKAGAKFYFLDITSKEAYKFRTIFGFCDGKDIYVKVSLHRTLKTYTAFSKILNRNRYCLLEYFTPSHRPYLTEEEYSKIYLSNPIVGIGPSISIDPYSGSATSIAPGFGYIPEDYHSYKTKSLENQTTYKVLDLQSGKIRMLTERRLKKIIADDKKLLQQFKKKRETYRKKPYARRDFFLKYYRNKKIKNEKTSNFEKENCKN